MANTWYVLDKDHDIVLSSSGSRAAAYEARKNHKSIYPSSRVKVVRFF